eukprot:scaffold550127_cov17-Prasinocladus_malaysianus.AAC.1
MYDVLTFLCNLNGAEKDDTAKEIKSLRTEILYNRERQDSMRKEMNGNLSTIKSNLADLSKEIDNSVRLLKAN